MFPLKKEKIKINNSEMNCLEDYSVNTEIPILPHPGAFSKTRRNHNHEGVDIYCAEWDEVFSMLDGTVIGIFPFTGEHVGSGWWNNTWSVLVRHDKFILNYGEIIPNKKIKIGDKVKEGDLLGNVTKVLKKDKGRPMIMLHLEMYSLDTISPLREWALNTEKPVNLLDPTEILLKHITE